jgi:ribosomal protein L5
MSNLEAEVNRLKENLNHLTTRIELILQKEELASKAYLNTQEAAEFLGLAPRTIRDYVKRQKLTGRRYTQRGNLYFTIQSLLDFQKANLRHAAYFS